MAVKVQVVFDCADPARLARFWAMALGYVEPDPPEGFESWDAWADAQGWPEEERNRASALVDPEGVGPRLYFQRVPETKVVKNRMHVDVNVAGGYAQPYDVRRSRIDAKVAELTAAGASVFRVQDRPPEEPEYYGVVMQDPEGNEFCVQ